MSKRKTGPNTNTKIVTIVKITLGLGPGLGTIWAWSRNSPVSLSATGLDVPVSTTMLVVTGGEIEHREGLQGFWNEKFTQPILQEVIKW